MRPLNTGSQRHRTSATKTLYVLDPAEVTVPPMPKGRRWSPEAQRWWTTAHHSAISGEWTADDLLVAERLLGLCDDLARLRKDPEIDAERKLRLSVQVSAEMRLLEASLGLSPAARARLRVEIERAEDAERRRAVVDPPVRSVPDGDVYASLLE